jgi:hypothetical protein
MNLVSSAIGEGTQFSNLGYLYGLMGELRGVNAQKQTIYLLQEYKCGKPESSKFYQATMFTSGEFGWELTFYLDIMTHDTSRPEGDQVQIFRLTAKPDGTRTGEILPYPYSRP